MSEALDIVCNLDDVQATMMLKQIYQDVFKAVPLEHVKQRVEYKGCLAMLQDIGTDVLKQNIDPEQSVALTRKVLKGLALDRDLSGLIMDSWERVKKDDSLVVETIITLGLIANLTLLMATTELKFEIRGIKVNKKGASAEQIKAVLSPLIELVKKITPGS